MGPLRGDGNLLGSASLCSVSYVEKMGPLRGDGNEKVTNLTDTIK